MNQEQFCYWLQGVAARGGPPNEAEWGLIKRELNAALGNATTVTVKIDAKGAVDDLNKALDRMTGGTVKAVPAPHPLHRGGIVNAPLPLVGSPTHGIEGPGYTGVAQGVARANDLATATITADQITAGTITKAG